MVPRRDPDARERLAVLAPRLGSGALAGERSLPVAAALSELLPAGLTRGTTVGCQGRAALSAAFLVAAGASQGGAWVAVAGLAALGVQACRQAGVALERLVVVREPATPFDDGLWGQVLASSIDGFDLVMFGAAPRVRPGTARRVQSRLQSRGAVLVLAGRPGPFSCDVQITADATWEGLGDGHGHLRSRRLDLAVDGRRIPRTRRTSLWFPDCTGAITPVDVAPGARPDPAPLRRTG